MSLTRTDNTERCEVGRAAQDRWVDEKRAEVIGNLCQAIEYGKQHPESRTAQELRRLRILLANL